MIKLGLVAAALVFSTAGLACDGKDVSAASGDMQEYRERALAQLRSENRVALQDSLRRAQSELTSATREQFLASQPGAISKGSARGAP